MAARPGVHMKPALSWGRTFRFEQLVETVSSRDARVQGRGNFLPYGLGRSYGDSCLNENGTLLSTRKLHRILALDEKKGTLEVEAGATVAECLEYLVPRGWFLPVVPGTKHVTIGGAIANDIHGKNHHRQGTFGCHVASFELRRSDESFLTCSLSQNESLFRATIGGLGLTGLITKATIRLKRITSSELQSETIRCATLNEVLDGLEASDKDFEYTVAWLDVLSKGKNLGRGILMRANHTNKSRNTSAKRPSRLNVPFEFPFRPLNRLTVKLFNTVYYWRHWKRRRTQLVNYDPFFFPLDSVQNWNRIYGKAGFFQYQLVVPLSSRPALENILAQIAHASSGSFLCVLKKFGPKKSPGLLSFPMEGYTLAVDFPNLGEKTRRLLSSWDAIVEQAGGRLYPAKDALMTGALFRSSYPHWKEIIESVDPNFSSSFWRRVTK